MVDLPIRHSTSSSLPVKRIFLTAVPRFRLSDEYKNYTDSIVSSAVAFANKRQYQAVEPNTQMAQNTPASNDLSPPPTPNLAATQEQARTG